MGDPEYIGDDENGVYWKLEQRGSEWWVKAHVDADHFTDDLPDLGPYLDEETADIEATHQAINWCLTNGVNP